MFIFVTRGYEGHELVIAFGGQTSLARSMSYL